MSEEQSITVQKSTLWKAGTFVFGALFLIVLIFSFTGNSTNTGTGNVIAPTQQPPVAGNLVVEIESNDPVLGNKDAKLSIVEFSDFECPFCASAFFNAITQFKNSDYFKNGEINLIYKQFPLSSIHPDAQKAAEASLCANDQGKFWEYHDNLFANQGALDTASLKSYASQLGLNTNTFNDCLDKGNQRQEVLKEVNQATSAGGRGTPYFVIVNNDNEDKLPVEGAVPWTNLEQAIQTLI